MGRSLIGMVRRERVHSSMLSRRRKHDRAALVTPRRGPKANPAVAQRNRDAQLTREIRQSADIDMETPFFEACVQS